MPVNTGTSENLAENRTFTKQADIAKEILDESPDLVFLCEFALYKNKVLDSLMTKSNNYTRYYQTGTMSVFYSKYEIDSIVGIYPSGSSNHPSRNNKVHLIVGNDTLSIFGLHLYSSNHHIMRGYEKRREESDSIYKDLKEEQYPMIIMGDFNDVSGSYAVERIKAAGLEDAWWNGGCGYGSTFHDRWLRLRLDHILYQDSKLKLTNVKVIDSDLSDHNALVAEFSIKQTNYAEN